MVVVFWGVTVLKISAQVRSKTFCLWGLPSHSVPTDLLWPGTQMSPHLHEYSTFSCPWWFMLPAAAFYLAASRSIMAALLRDLTTRTRYDILHWIGAILLPAVEFVLFVILVALKY